MSRHTKFPVYKKCQMCMKCHSYVLTQEMFLIFCPMFTAPEKAKEMSKYPGAGNMKCPYHEPGNVNYILHISWPRKFRISSSGSFNVTKVMNYIYSYIANNYSDFQHWNMHLYSHGQLYTQSHISQL